jgi:hypothetical protein
MRELKAIATKKDEATIVATLFFGCACKRDGAEYRRAGI